MNYLTSLRLRFAALISIYALFAVFFAGCLLPARIAGGRVIHNGTELRQGQDAKQPSTLNQERDEQIVLPAGSLLMVGTNSFRVSSNTTYYVHDKINSTLGAAQKNGLAEVSAKLASLSWLTYLGAALVIFAGISAFYPPVKLIVNSLTTSLVCAVTGVAFIALPTLLVGHELLILAVGISAVAVYWFAHHHGSISAELRTLKTIFTAPSPEQAAPEPPKPETK